MFTFRAPGGQRRAAFSMFELLVILAVLAILVGLLLPAVQKVREAAGRRSSTLNLKEMCIAMQAVHDANQKFPPAYLAIRRFSTRSSSEIRPVFQGFDHFFELRLGGGVG